MAMAKKDALRLLSFRPRSTQELRARLLRKNYQSELVETVIEYFLKQGLLDDEKFAKLYTLSRIQGDAIGKKQIRYDLENKGVPRAVVDRALGSVDDFDERQVALDIAQRRHRRMSRLPENVSRARLYGFLKRRGFAGEAVFYALSKLYKKAENFAE